MGEAVLAVLRGPLGVLVLDVAVVVRLVFGVVVVTLAMVVMMMVLAYPMVVLAERVMEAHVHRRHELEPA
jgi:hypothetical protein